MPKTIRVINEIRLAGVTVPGWSGVVLEEGEEIVVVPVTAPETVDAAIHEWVMRVGAAAGARIDAEFMALPGEIVEGEGSVT